MVHHQPLDYRIVAAFLHDNTALGVLITEHGLHIPIAGWVTSTARMGMVVVIVRVVVASVRADLGRGVVHHLRLRLLLGLMHHHHVAVQTPQIVHHRGRRCRVMMVPLHARHEVVALLLL